MAFNPSALQEAMDEVWCIITDGTSWGWPSFRESLPGSGIPRRTLGECSKPPELAAHGKSQR